MQDFLKELIMFYNILDCSELSEITNRQKPAVFAIKNYMAIFQKKNLVFNLFVIEL